jgi:hypothetical protein
MPPKWLERPALECAGLKKYQGSRFRTIFVAFYTANNSRWQFKIRVVVLFSHCQFMYGFQDVWEFRSYHGHDHYQIE